MAVSSWFVRGHQDQASGCWSSTRRSAGCPSTSRTASSASGWRTPATGRSPATGSGARRSRSGAATTRRTPASTSTARSTSSSATSASRSPDDLHRPFVDELTRPNPDDPTGQSTMRRVDDVLDVWFDSGSMSFAQVHYPFENADWFEHHFPGDFIVEYIGQTRGWFYTMHVLATALFDRPAFATCLSHGIVLGSDGKKMSQVAAQLPRRARGLRPRRRRRDALVPDVSPDPARRQPRRHRAGHPRLGAAGADPAVEQLVLLRLYANAAGEGTTPVARPTRPHPMDRYILAKPRQYVDDVDRQLDDYEVAAACDSTRTFLDVLTNWYIRRSRERFWAADGFDAAAFDTLYTVLEVVCRVTAPLLPLTTEEVWRGLTGERSVHLTDWPAADDLPADDALVASMDAVRDVCSAGSALRKAANLRNRLPLAPMTIVVAGADRLAGFEPIVADELNLKPVGCSTPTTPRRRRTASRSGSPSTPAPPGPRLGKDVQTAIKGSKSGDWSVAEDGTVTAGGLALVEGEYALETVAGRRRRRRDRDAAARRLRRARHRAHPRARGRGPRPRPGARGAAGPQGRRPRGLRPDRADVSAGRVARRGAHPRGADRRARRSATDRSTSTPRPPRSRSPVRTSSSTTSAAAGWMGMPWSSTSIRRRRHPHPAARRHRVGQPPRAGDRRRGRGGAARRCRTSR